VAKLPKLGNWAFPLGQWAVFSIRPSVLTATYRETGMGKGPIVALKLMIIVCHLFLFNWVCNRKNGHFCEKM